MVTVWGRRSSSNVQKVLWALAESGAEFERVTVGGSFGGNQTPEYKKLNPLGLVPAIKDGSITMFESNAIMRYVARRYGRGTLQPRGYRGLALAEQWVEFASTAIIPPVFIIFQNKVRKPPEQYDEQAVKGAEKTCKEVFKIANRLLGRKPFVGGRSFSYGDIPLGIAYYRYKNLDVDGAALPNLDRWYAALQERPAYREWIMVPFGRNLGEWNEHERELK